MAGRSRRRQGRNLTTSEGNQSFAEAVFAAQLLACRDGKEALVLAADEFHETWTPMLDAASGPPEDGGDALLLSVDATGAQARLVQCILAAIPEALLPLARPLAQSGRVGLLLVGAPQGPEQATCACQLAELRQLFPGLPFWSGRDHLGNFATVSAGAAALAVHCVQEQRIPPGIVDKACHKLSGKSVLLAGLGEAPFLLEFAQP